MELNIDLNLLKTEPFEDYRAKTKDFLNWHSLKDFIDCPLLYYKKTQGLIEDKDSSYFSTGRAAHKRILEGEVTYSSAYAVGGPVNPKTGKPYGTETKAFEEWALLQGKPVVSHAQNELISQMADGVAANKNAAELLLNGKAEGVVRSSYCATPCQIRIDWLNPTRGLVEFKTTDDLTWFEKDIYNYGYIGQLAFYHSVLMHELKVSSIPVYLIAVEKREPFRCGVWNISYQTLDQSRERNEKAIKDLLVCRESNVWPTNYEEIRTL